MNVVRVLYPVEVLGPGKRLGIWLCGCPHHCAQCCNPELWEQQDRYEVPLAAFLAALDRMADRLSYDGVVITGGEPFFQVEALSGLLDYFSEKTEDVLVYTGYTMEELQAENSGEIRHCLSKIGVLIDGRYEDERNTGARLRGSSNQRILFLNPGLEERYRQYLLDTENSIQNFSVRDGMISVGIHHKNFNRDMIRRAREKGVIAGNG